MVYWSCIGQSYVGESIANLLLGSGVSVGLSTIHAGNGCGSSGDDTLEAIDELLQSNQQTRKSVDSWDKSLPGSQWYRCQLQDQEEGHLTWD